MKIIITGASKGLGRILSEEFVMRGHSVGMIARSESLLRETSGLLSKNKAGWGKVFWRACDLNDYDYASDMISELVEEMSGVDAIINCANTTVKKNIFEMSTNEWSDSINTGLNAAFNSIRLVALHFIKQGAGHIINIGSLSTKIPLERGCSYTASKFALSGFSKSMTHELHSLGVKVCTIHPGAFYVDEDDSSTWKMPATEVFRACEYVLNSDAKAFVEEITVRPLNWPEN